MVTLKLEAGGFEVLSRSNLEDGLKAASDQEFDLYLLDLWLTDGSGLDLCKKIREFDVKTPVVFYSAAAYEGDREAALDSGGQAYLIKPARLSRFMREALSASCKTLVVATPTVKEASE